MEYGGGTDSPCPRLLRRFGLVGIICCVCKLVEALSRGAFLEGLPGSVLLEPHEREQGAWKKREDLVEISLPIRGRSWMGCTTTGFGVETTGFPELLLGVSLEVFFDRFATA